jgi:hypothetical protein
VVSIAGVENLEKRNTSSPDGNLTPAVNPLARRYINWVIPARTSPLKSVKYGTRFFLILTITLLLVSHTEDVPVNDLALLCLDRDVIYKYH